MQPHDWLHLSVSRLAGAHLLWLWQRGLAQWLRLTPGRAGGTPFLRLAYPL